MEIPSKPTSMTKFEEIEEAWHQFCSPDLPASTYEMETWSGERHVAEDKLVKLCNYDIELSFVKQNTEDFAVIGGCIMLAEEV